jgi:methyl-accepting chemotaxis protein
MAANETQEKKVRVGLMGKMGMTAKITIITVILVVAALLTALFVNKSAYTSRIQNMVKNDMLAVADAFGQAADNALSHATENLTAEEWGALVGKAIIPNDSSGYIYVVGEDGTMLYHPTADKIGQPVENAGVKGLVSQMASGTYPAPNVMEYEYKGAMKYAGFYITSVNGYHNIVVVSADLEKITKETSAIPTIVIIVVIVVPIIIALVSILLIRAVLKPILKLNDSLERVSNLDFTEDPELLKYVNWTNETGQLARNTVTMCDKIDNITKGIKEAVDQIVNSSESLKLSVEDISNASMENGQTTEQMAAGMQETTATTDTIANNMSEMVDKSGQVVHLADDGINVSKEIYKRAADGINQANSAKTRANEVLAGIKKNTEEALEGAKAIDQINELTETIRGISDQTELLSLNASIEAARAGESGRGFAVVATEIGKLASESSDTVEQINGIVSEIKGAVDGITKCLSEVLEFAETSTKENLEAMEAVSNQYNDDAAVFENNLTQMKSQMDELNSIISMVDDAIAGINTTIGESANGITDVAGKTDDIVNQTRTAQELIGENVSKSESLQEVIAKFKL